MNDTQRRQEEKKNCWITVCTNGVDRRKKTIFDLFFFFPFFFCSRPLVRFESPRALPSSPETKKKKIIVGISIPKGGGNVKGGRVRACTVAQAIKFLSLSLSLLFFHSFLSSPLSLRKYSTGLQSRRRAIYVCTVVVVVAVKTKQKKNFLFPIFPLLHPVTTHDQKSRKKKSKVLIGTKIKGGEFIYKCIVTRNQGSIANDVLCLAAVAMVTTGGVGTMSTPLLGNQKRWHNLSSRFLHRSFFCVVFVFPAQSFE